MPPAVIAGVGAAATIGGSLIGASSTRRAARDAADAQLTASRETNALAQNIYNQNTANFQPFMNSGQNANALLDAFIYGGPVNYPQAANTNAPQAYQPQPSMYDYVNNPGTPHYVSRGRGALDQPANQNEPYGLTGGMGQGYQQPQGTITSQVRPQTAQSAWDQFRNSTNYNFRLGEGMNALNSGWAGAGALQSGAAMKDAIRYGQNFGSNELNNYLALVQGQQALGAGAASSLAGVGNDFLSSVTANNRASADAQSNAALLRGQANQQMYGGIANALGGFASSFKGW